MTKAEAIKALEIELNQWEADCKSYHAVKEALPMAIEALENENALTDRVLEIIDKVGNRAEVGDMDAYEVYTEIRFGVLALKGERG